MPLIADGPAPYAPPAAVIDVVDGFRTRGLSTPITSDVLLRAGVSQSLAPRTLAALRLLELVDDGDNPTQNLIDLRKAPTDEYQARFAALLHEVYAEIFNFADPAQDPPDKVADAFRAFTPPGQRDRMVTLFLGLCAHAGVIDDAAPGRRSTPSRPKAQHSSPRSNGERARQRTQEPVVQNERQDEREHRVAPVPPAAAGHPLIQGLFQALPPVGSVWSAEERDIWAQAALGNFALLYKLDADFTEGGGDD